jgi:hypothetical protein
MKICISDKHVGCQLWQAAILRKLGHEVIVRSFSGHAKYLESTESLGSFSKIERIGPQLSATNTENLLTDSELADCLQFDLLVVSFPPCFYENFKQIPFRNPILVNCGHRLHIQCVKDKNFLVRLTRDIIENKIVLGSMSQYDTEYIRHYLGIKPLELYVSCFHVPKNTVYNPVRTEILVGPSHVTTTTPFKNIEDMNSQAKKHNIKFDKIKNLYPNYTYKNLTDHPAIVLFPYSSFSISIIECYEMNIPMFIPSKKLLLSSDLMYDVCLYPCYGNKNEIEEIDKPHLSSPHKYSPNSYNYEDREYWSQFYYFYQRKNIVTWDGPEDLFEKITTMDLKKISEEMKKENEHNDTEHLLAWEHLLETYPSIF